MNYTDNRRPNHGEICTACHHALHKRAALLFDRLYIAPSHDERKAFDTPPELTFGFEEAEAHIIPCFDQLMIESQQRSRDVMEGRAYYYRALARAYAKEGCTVVPSFSSYRSFDDEFNTGAQVAYEGALQNILVVDDKKLDWAQILEFRQDKESLRKYRDFRLWLRSGLKAASPSEAVDIVGAKLDAYEWSMKKHGFETVQGAVTFVLDFKQAGLTASAMATGAVFGGPILSALAGGLVITGQISAWIMKRLIEREDIKRGANCEVAFIHDINKRFGGQ